MIGIILIFTLLVAVIFTATSNTGCYTVGGFILIFTVAIMHQLIEFKKGVNKFACPACSKNSLCEKFCTSTKLFAVIAFFLSIIMSVSLISFLLLTEKFFILIIGMDVFVFHYFYTQWNKTQSNQLVGDASKVVGEVAINFFNILILLVMLIALEFMYAKSIDMNPDIFYTIKEKIHHSCKLFEYLLRTKELTNTTIYLLRNIEQIGDILFSFFYISTLSLLPMTAITLLYKFGIKMEQKILRKMDKKS
jgi:hypothetical protein